MTVTEIVFNVISLGLEYIVVLVFDLPTGASILDNGFDSCVSNFKIGDESVLVKGVRKSV